MIRNVPGMVSTESEDRKQRKCPTRPTEPPVRLWCLDEENTRQLLLLRHQSLLPGSEGPDPVRTTLRYFPPLIIRVLASKLVSGATD
jgi:hypothetical protein